MTTIRSSRAMAQKNAGSDAANVLADHASARRGRLFDHAYAIPNGTPTAMAPASAVASRIAVFAIASSGVTTRKIGRVFIRSELRRSSDVSRRAGSVRNTTSKEATTRGRKTSRKTRASTAITDAPVIPRPYIATDAGVRCQDTLWTAPVNLTTGALCAASRQRGA